MKAKVKVVVMLTNPPGVWENEQNVQYAKPEQLDGFIQTLMVGFTGVSPQPGKVGVPGITEQVDEHVWRLIPYHRVVDITVTAEVSLLTEDTNVGQAAAQAEQKAQADAAVRGKVVGFPGR